MKQEIRNFYKKARKLLRKNWWDVRYLLLFATVFLFFRFDKFIKWLTQNTGSVADWFSAIGTVAAFFAIFWQMDKQEKMERAFRIEQSRPRFMFMIRGKLPDKTNILLDDSEFYSVLEDGEDGSPLKYMVDNPHFNNLITLENISSNTIYTFEIIIFNENGEETYWTQNGLQQHAIVAPVPVSLIKKVKDTSTDHIINVDHVDMGAKQIKVRFTTSFNETGFYKLDITNGEEEYYFINETNNSEVQAGKNGKMLETNDEKTEELNAEFEKYKSKDIYPSTIPYCMLKI